MEEKCPVSETDDVSATGDSNRGLEWLTQTILACLRIIHGFFFNA
jgi:hypothetical protein